MSGGTLSESEQLSESFQVENVFQIENVLLQLVKEAVKITRADHGSIFLKEEGTARYILRDSTSMNPYIGNDFFTLEDDEKPEKCMGVTKLCALKRKPVHIEDVHNCDKWSNFEGCNKKVGACELTYGEVGPFLAVPMIENDNVIGVIRVVRSINKKPFSPKDVKSLDKLVKSMTPEISGALDISHLLELGPLLDSKALCTKIVKELKKIVKGRGCTIFLRVPDEKPNVKTFRCFGTTGLHGLNKEGMYEKIEDPYKDAYYDYDEDESPRSFTTAVIKHKRNIIIEDFMNQKPEEVDFDKNLDSPPKFVATYYRKKRGGGQELVPAGPSMYIPLFYPGYNTRDKSNNLKEKPDVMGVIILNRPQRTKKNAVKEFTPQEQRMCINLSKRLSKIILLSNYMSLLNEPIVAKDEESIKESLNNLIERIRQVTGTQRTSLFLKSVDGKKLERYIHFGNYEVPESYDLPDNKEYYGKDNKYRGFTLWVSLFDENLCYNDKKELKKLNKKPEPHFSNRVMQGGRLMEMPDRFLGVPISTPGNVLGVLTSANTEADQPFSETDVMLFSSLATRLYPILNTIIDSKKLTYSKDQKLENIFSHELMVKSRLLHPKEIQSRLYNKQKEYIYESIGEVVSSSLNGEISVSDKVRRSISQLWEKSGFEMMSKTIKKYELLNGQILSELPLYRDHFIHQYQVFLLGQYIIDQLNYKRVPFFKTYYESISERNQKNNQVMDKNANIAWILTSTAHDIAYPIEKINDWIPSIITTFLDPRSSSNGNIKPILSIDNYLFSNEKFIRLVDDLTDYLVDNGLIKGIKKDSYRSWIFNEIVRKKDHGALGSLFMLSSQNYNTNNITSSIVLSSSLAISLHNMWGKVKNTNNLIEYDKFPLLFLLMYCDLVQEWGRSCSIDHKVSFNMDKIFITREINKLLDQNKYPDEFKILKSLGDNTIFVCCEISGKGNIDHKIKECEQVMSVLSSRNPCFIIKLNGEPYLSHI